MKIIRTFCGTFSKANKRNQSIIFGYFFPISKMIPMVNPLTETKYAGRFEVPREYKMRFRRNREDRVVFVSYQGGEEIEESPREIWEGKLNYFRQYLYLIAKCMKQRHEANIEEFREEFPLDILC